MISHPKGARPNPLEPPLPTGLTSPGYTPLPSDSHCWQCVCLLLPEGGAEQCQHGPQRRHSGEEYYRSVWIKLSPFKVYPSGHGAPGQNYNIYVDCYKAQHHILLLICTITKFS